LNPGGAGSTSNESSVANEGSEREVPVTSSYVPYKISSNTYSLCLIDRDIIKRYRAWLQNFFKNEF
jgi:hypothetical protein